MRSAQLGKFDADAFRNAVLGIAAVLAATQVLVWLAERKLQRT